jgi:uncharacterized protein YdhG (YjbR/CyaY superfamily)
VEARRAVRTVDDYISGFAPEIQDILQTLRKVVRESAPNADEKISYQMPTFAQHGNLVHFAAFKHHIGFYPTSSGTEAFRDELAGYKGSKGAVQFPLDRPVPYELVGRIVRFRVAENSRRAESRSRKR